MMQYCECKPPINFSVEFPNHTVIIPNSHKYQVEAFVYICVILLNYFFLTTVLMVKLILLAPSRVTPGDVEERKSFDMQVLKQFREREKKKTADFEKEARRRVKERMVNYLKTMQHMAGFPGLDDDQDRSITDQTSTFSNALIATSGTPMRRAISAGDYSATDDDQSDFPAVGRSISAVVMSKEKDQLEESDLDLGRREFQDSDVDPIWMTRSESKEYELKLNKRLSVVGNAGFYVNADDGSEFEQYV